MTDIDILIPVLNEENSLKECLESVVSFEIPEKTGVHIYVIDGMSEDRSREIIEDFRKKFSNITLLENPNRIQSSALNIGIKQSKSKFILRLDAHSSYPRDYLLKCHETMLRTNSDNVGGIAITEPGSNSYSALVVQSLTTHWFGVGNSGFRIGISEGEVDTVPYGFFNSDIFKKLGLFDERLVRAQDYEFNARIKQNGGKIWLNPNISFSYKNQSSFFNFLKKQIFLEAPYNAYMWYLAPYTFNVRHSITCFFSLGVIGGITLSSFSSIIKIIFIFVMGLYLLLSIYSSFMQAIRYRKVMHIFSLPFAFLLFHFLHGLGVIYGLLMILIKNSPVNKKNSIP